MTRIASLLLGALLVIGGLSLAPPARAADLQVYVYDPGVCADTRFLGKITSRFRHQVRHVPHLPDVSIEEFRDIHENRYLPSHEDRPIGRRYCGATVVLSDGTSRPIWYLIEEGMGFASIGDNVEFCVSGFDRWMVYNGRCRILR
jgi:capsid protein